MARDARWTLIKIKSAKMYNNITLDRLEQIQRERDQTQSDRSYQRWVKELNVGRMYVDRQSVHNANQIMQDWDSSKLNFNSIVVNP
jgi:hypothetical protein